MAAVSSQGTTFVFNAVTYECTDIQVEESIGDPANEKKDVSTLALADGANREYADAPLVDTGGLVDEAGDPIPTVRVTITFMGSSKPPCLEATLTTTGASGTFRCTQSSISRRVGEFVEGTATFVNVPA